MSKHHQTSTEQTRQSAALGEEQKSKSPVHDQGSADYAEKNEVFRQWLQSWICRQHQQGTQSE